MDQVEPLAGCSHSHLRRSKHAPTDGSSLSGRLYSQHAATDADATNGHPAGRPLAGPSRVSPENSATLRPKEGHLGVPNARTYVLAFSSITSVY